MNYKLTKAQAKEKLENQLLHFSGVSADHASYEQFYKAISEILRDMLAVGRSEISEKADKTGKKRVYYLSMEFLMGRSLKNNLYNMNLTSVFQSVLKDYGITLEKLYECEPDAGLGNGGLGRLAACYMDALATGGYAARGYSILYENGIFKQKFVDGCQVALPDTWLPGGEVWLSKRESSAVEVLLEGNLVGSWDGKYYNTTLENATKISAVPYDMFVSGKDGRGVSVVRLWSAKVNDIDMELFSKGKFTSALEAQAMAAVISKVLYPPDNYPEGKSLRLKQQYFLVSASIQDILRHHLRVYGTCDNLAEKVAIHINDTHPTMVIPELMRILLDECGYGWDEAWKIVTNTVAYTNHTVLSEALECWNKALVQKLIPRVYQIIEEIDRRFRVFVRESTGDSAYEERTAIISGDSVRMANLCVAACHSVNGVSALHSEIIKKDLFNDFYKLTPDKFTNVTNGIAYRRWLCQANPLLRDFLTELIGKEFILDASRLSQLEEYAGDSSVLNKLGEIKKANKERFAANVYKSTGIALDTSSVFDVQVKRLHEYKRQHLNAFDIVSRYLEIKDNPDGEFIPHTYIFGAKAAPGYFMAQRIISFILALADCINNDPDVRDRLKIVFIEDYNVTRAELLMPAAEISEQISLAGKEASGTGNMKLMMNGAVTLGTLDGANVEIYEAVGDDNMFLFGLHADEAARLEGTYSPSSYYQNNSEIRRVIDRINAGINGQSFSDIGGTIIHHDPFMVLADFADYRLARQRACEAWLDSDKWNKMSLINIARSGRFSADRAIAQYAQSIWNAGRV